MDGEGAAQGKLHVGRVGKRITSKKVRGLLLVQRRGSEARWMVLDPENASGMSATILSIADKNGSFDGSGCAGRWIFSGSRLCARSLPSLSISSARRWQRALSAASMCAARSPVPRLRALVESSLEIGGDVHQLPHQGNRGAQLRLEMRAVLRSKDEPSQPRGTDAGIERKTFHPTRCPEAALPLRSAKHFSTVCRRDSIPSVRSVAG